MDDSFKEEVKTRSDIVEIIGSYMTLKRAGGTFKGLCPFHNEKTPSFNVNPDRQAFYCFGCQKGGDVIAFVMEHEGLPFQDALHMLARRANVAIPEWKPSGDGSGKAAAARDRKTQLYDLHEKLSTWFQSNLRKDIGREALLYVRERGLSDDILVQFGIGYAPEAWDAAKTWGLQHGFSEEIMRDAGIITSKDENSTHYYDRFRNRLMFPITNEQGRIIAFSGRVLSSDAPGGKYVNSPETPIFHKSNVLYGLSLARQGIKAAGHVVVCEGQMDVIACHRAGVSNVVAPQGTAFTELQARLIKRYTDSIVLAFDGDSAGINAAIKSIDAFIPVGLTAKVVIFPEGSDPDSIVGSAGGGALRTRFEQQQDYMEFLMEAEIRRFGTATPTDKARVVDAVLEAVTRIPNSIARSEYCEIIAARLQLRSEAVFEQLRTVHNGRKRREQGRPSANYAPSPPPQEVREMAPFVVPAEPLHVQTAEKGLLDLALHHKAAASRLLLDLPPEHISKTPIGETLNEVLAMTEQGEWDDCCGLLTERLEEIDPAVREIVITPQYNREYDARTLNKAYRDCIVKLKRYRLDQAIADVIKTGQSELDDDRKEELRSRYRGLQDEKKNLNTWEPDLTE
jgi:DNA primase